MTSTRILATVICAVGCFGGSAGALAETTTCPALFPSASLHFTPTTDGWTAEPGGNAPFLVGWSLSSGPPSDLAQLQPSDSGKDWESWKLEGPYPKGVWVQCLYGGGGLSLSRPLPRVTGVCTVHYEKTLPRKPKPISFVCK